MEPAGAVGWVFPLYLPALEAGALRVANFSRVRRGEAAPGGTDLAAAAPGGSGGRELLRGGVWGTNTAPGRPARLLRAKSICLAL